MTPSEIKSHFFELEYSIDIRVLGYMDTMRRGRFLMGWEDATIRGKNYRPETLDILTWTNLGNRMGNKFGSQSREQIYEAFEILDRLKRE